jgi:Tol biopolymer transport system component
MRKNSVISQKRSRRLAALLVLTLLPGFPFLSCHKDSPSQAEVPRGVFVEKLAYTNWKLLPPRIAIADLYNDNGIFRLYNHKDLADGGTPSLSRDESFIVFLYVKNGTHVRRIRSDGSQLRDLLSQENLSPQEVSISPDAKEIIVSYFQKDLPGMHLGIMPADGGPLTRIYSHKAVGFAPDWFPTGDKIILTYADFDQRFPHRTPQGDRAKNYMVSMNKDGANMQFISDTLSGLSNDLYPMISPDEKKSHLYH